MDESSGLQIRKGVTNGPVHQKYGSNDAKRKENNIIVSDNEYKARKLDEIISINSEDDPQAHHEDEEHEGEDLEDDQNYDVDVDDDGDGLVSPDSQLNYSQVFKQMNAQHRLTIKKSPMNRNEPLRHQEAPINRPQGVHVDHANFADLNREDGINLKKSSSSAVFLNPAPDVEEHGYMHQQLYAGSIGIQKSPRQSTSGMQNIQKGESTFNIHRASTNKHNNSIIMKVNS